ncbi:ABC transporter permease [Bacillus pseudomycoides]|uniref:ABC transporter permease n=1 Tax=Bacillus pseudomycoides TaxID=64104 RepID=UPI003D24A573
MESLIWKEFRLVKSRWQKTFFILFILAVLSLYATSSLKTLSIPMKFNFILGVTSIIFMSEIIFESIKSDKVNKTLEKLLPLFSAEKIILAKTIFGMLTATLVSIIYSMAFFIYFVVLKGYPQFEILSVISLLPVINLLFGNILTILILLIDNMFVTKLLTMAGTIIYILLFSNTKDIELVLISVSVLFTMAVLLNMVIKKRSIENIL